MKKETKLEYTAISNYKEQSIFLEVFKETELQPMGYMDLNMLEQLFKYQVKIDIQVYDWLEGEKAKDKHHGMNARDQKYTLKTLVKECAEVRQFAVEHFPEYVI